MARTKATRNRMAKVKKQAIAGSVPFNSPMMGASTRDGLHDYHTTSPPPDTESTQVGTYERRVFYAERNSIVTQPTTTVPSVHQPRN